MTVWRIVTPAGRTFFAQATDHEATLALVRLNFPEVVGDSAMVAELLQPKRIDVAAASRSVTNRPIPPLPREYATS
jgi:hypothetical protein